MNNIPDKRHVILDRALFYCFPRLRNSQYALKEQFLQIYHLAHKEAPTSRYEKIKKPSWGILESIRFLSVYYELRKNRHDVQSHHTVLYTPMYAKIQ